MITSLPDVLRKKVVRQLVEWSQNLIAYLNIWRRRLTHKVTCWVDLPASPACRSSYSLPGAVSKISTSWSENDCRCVSNAARDTTSLSPNKTGRGISVSKSRTRVRCKDSPLSRAAASHLIFNDGVTSLKVSYVISMYVSRRSRPGITVAKLACTQGLDRSQKPFQPPYNCRNEDSSRVSSCFPFTDEGEVDRSGVG